MATEAGDDSAGLELARDMLNFSDWKLVKRWEVADVWFKLARIHRRQGKFVQSVMAASRAVMIRPIVLARPLKPLLRRLWKHPSLQHGS